MREKSCCGSIRPLCPQLSHSSADFQHFLANGWFGEIVRFLLHQQRRSTLREIWSCSKVNRSTASGSKQPLPVIVMRIRNLQRSNDRFEPFDGISGRRSIQHEGREADISRGCKVSWTISQSGHSRRRRAAKSLEISSSKL